jgi:HEAT repeat protein
MVETKSLAVQLQAPLVAERAEAARQLCLLGEEACDVAVALVRACGDENEQVVEWATAALEQLGPPPLEQLSDLANLTADTNPLVGYWAVTLIGRLGGDAAPATGALVATLQNSTDSAVKQRAAWALGKVPDASEATLAALDQAVQSSDPRLARLAAQARANCQ